jgi:hypothetical protein
MAESKVIPLTEEEMLYTVPPKKAKKGEAKVIHFTLAGKPVAGIKPLVIHTAPPDVEPVIKTSSKPSFFKENQTLLIVVGVVAALAIGYYIYDRQQKKKVRNKDSGKKIN